MFIHEMTHQVGDATHVHVSQILEDATRVKVSGVFGYSNSFVADPVLRPCERQIVGAERVAYEAFVQERSEGNAPPGESRREDKIAWLDLHGWAISSWEPEAEEEEEPEPEPVDS